MKPWLALCTLSLLSCFALAVEANAANEKLLHVFCSKLNCLDGGAPEAGLSRDAKGNLFGTAEIGGKHGDGVVFELEKHRGRYKYRVLHDFCFDCGDGDFPTASVVVDTAGNLYGVTTGGGPHDCGVVFELAPATKKYETLYTFCATTSDADEPSAGLSYAGKSSGALYDGTSPLYGVTDRGGAQNSGTAYELRPGGDKWRETIIYSFCVEGSGCDDGWNPSGELLVDSSGNLFGSTELGGTNRLSAGVTYELERHGKTWNEHVLYAFCSADDCSDGEKPNGALVMDASGDLYGTAEDVDSHESGAVFKLSPHGKTWQETLLHVFCTKDCSDGYGPMGGLVMDATGTLYGTTAFGGSGAGGTGAGSVFRLQGKKFKTLYSFCVSQNCTDGAQPLGTLFLAPDGVLFGTTAQGGGPDGQQGTAFRLKL